MVSRIVEQARAQYAPGTPYDVPIFDGSLIEVLETSATYYPDRIAIDYFGATLTYSQVYAQVLRAAQVLVEHGVRKGDVVAIALPNCPQAFVAYYACMRIGAVAAQHNPLAPASEIREQLERHGGRTAIVWEKCADSYPLAPESALTTVFTVNISASMPRGQRFLLSLPVEKARSTREQLRGTAPAGTLSWDQAVTKARLVNPATPHATGDDLAVILHTGGTNGVPKSVPLTHRNVGTNITQCVMWVFRLHEGAETFFSLLPYFHAYGLTFFLGAAVRLAATQLVLPKFDPDLTLEAYRRRPVTFFVGVPPMFEKVMTRAQETHTSLSSIKWSICGAMPLSASLAQRWEEATGGVISEGYGMSETSPVICGVPLADNRRRGALGLPFPSTDVRLVDLDDPTRDVADGEPGEIIVKGPQVFSGYLNAPEETARVFTEDGWLRTGDVAVNNDGFLTMSDRKKELIFSGGFNVYPSQVEDAIRLMPGVKDVAVVGMPAGEAREEVTAALILEEDAPMITLEQVRLWAEKYVSHYALPRQIAFISELPRNPLGKVMRRRVKEQLVDPAARMWEEAGTRLEEATARFEEATKNVGEAMGEAVAPVVDKVSPLAASLGHSFSEAAAAVHEAMHDHRPSSSSAHDERAPQDEASDISPSSAHSSVPSPDEADASSVSSPSPSDDASRDDAPRAEQD